MDLLCILGALLVANPLSRVEGLGLIHTAGRAEPSRAEPDRTELNRAERVTIRIASRADPN
jgi:hypothetical protein